MTLFRSIKGNIVPASHKSKPPGILPIFLPFLGCPERCSYCDQSKVTRTKVPLSPPKKEEIFALIQDGLKLFKKKENIEIALYGGSITALPAQLQEELLQAVHMNPHIPNPAIRLSTLPNALSFNTIKRLQHYSVKTVELGVQSMEEKVLNTLGRSYTPQTVLESVAKLQSAGIRVVAQLMCGVPYETLTGFMKGLETLFNAGVGIFRIYPLVLFNGTVLKEKLANNEIALPSEDKTMELLKRATALIELKQGKIIRLSLPDRPSNGEGLSHPALKNLIASQLAEELLSKALSACGCSKKTEEEVIITPPANRLSEYIGHKRCTLNALQRKYPHTEVKIKGCKTINADTFMVSYQGAKRSFKRTVLLQELLQ